MFSRGREQALDDYPLPEMLRTRLEEVILNIKLLQLGKVGPFLQRVPDSPDPKAVSLALQVSNKITNRSEQLCRILEAGFSIRTCLASVCSYPIQSLKTPTCPLQNHLVS